MLVFKADLLMVVAAWRQKERKEGEGEYKKRKSEKSSYELLNERWSLLQGKSPITAE